MNTFAGARGSDPRRRAAAPLPRGQLALLVTLVLVTIGAWAVTIIQARSMSGDLAGMAPPPTVEDAATGMGGMEPMAGMAGIEWGLGGLAAFVVAWAVMMAAMMLPAATPMFLLYRAMASKQQSGGRAFALTWLLVAGYLLIWTVVGVGVYVLLRLGGDAAARLGVGERGRWAPLALGLVLVLAGLYQFTPLKHACLRQCQSPIGFVMGHWRDGGLGALRMGVVHGLYCLGCCWALFAVLVAAGVMSLAWMLLLTLVVFAEKAFPVGRRASQLVGVAFVVLGVLIAGRTTGMPWQV